MANGRGIRIPDFAHEPHLLPLATETSDGVMSFEDKIKLDNLIPGGGAPIDVETFRMPGFTDAQTIQAAVNEGVGLVFPSRTYTINQGETIINTLCHYMLCSNTTWRIGNGAIVNTDANRTNFTPFMQVRGVQGFLLEGSLIVDGNAANQTYPATNPDFGRGTAAQGSAGRRFNGIVEFVAGADNLTPCRDIIIDGEIEVKNGYLNGLVFCQCERIEVRSVYTHENAVNGISGEGCTTFLAEGTRHYRDGVSAQYPSTISGGDRAGIQFREIPGTYTAAQLLFPFIPRAVGTNSFVNFDINFSNCSAEECQVEGFFQRMCFPGRMANCFSKNVCYSRDPSTSFVGAHFWAEGGWYEFNNLLGLQSTDNDALGWQRPEGFVLQTYDGTGAGGTGGNPIGRGGLYHSYVNGIEIMCGYTAGPPGAAQNNYGRGCRIFSECTVESAYIEGTTDSAILVLNDTNFNILPPRNVTLRDIIIENIFAQYPVWYVRFGGAGVTGTCEGLVIDNLKARNCRATQVSSDDHAIINLDDTMAAYAVTFQATNLDLDCFNSLAPVDPTFVGYYNGVRLRTGVGSNIGVNFTNCVNALSPLHQSGAAGGGGFDSLTLTGSIGPNHRIWRIDAALWTANAGMFKFDIDAIGITSQLFFVQGFVSSGFKITAIDANYRVTGATTCRTFPAGAPGTSGNITTTPDTFFTEALWYKWGPNYDGYGSAAPATNIYDMRRTFTAAGLPNAIPYYNGELVVETDNVQNYMGINKNTAGTWSLLSAP